MTLLVRTFRSAPAQSQRLLDVLQSTATGMIRNQQADAVLLCQVRDTRGGILWVENRRADAGTIPGPPRQHREILDQAGPSRPLEFLDGFYRFPIRPWHVWSLDLQTEPGLQAEMMCTLLRLVRHAPDDPLVAGLSLYRVASEPGAFVAFVALSTELVPEQYFRKQLALEAGTGSQEPSTVWQPLSVSWAMGRLSFGGPPLLSPARYPPTAFWARSGRE